MSSAMSSAALPQSSAPPPPSSGISVVSSTPTTVAPSSSVVQAAAIDVLANAIYGLRAVPSDLPTLFEAVNEARIKVPYITKKMYIMYSKCDISRIVPFLTNLYLNNIILLVFFEIKSSIICS
jgi:hypothetical protein